MDSGKGLAHSLRHPALEAHYFQELYEAWPAWKNTLQPSLVYEAYFSSPGSDIGITFWQSLIDASITRPVFHACRTSGRIGAIKDSLAGYHIYLWRNPWDQWWSYKATPHFDAANQLIMHVPGAPDAVALLRTSLGLESHGTMPLAQALAYYAERPLDSNESYLIFYMLWCLGLREGILHGDLVLNIDRLSDSPVYRDEILSHLADAGVEELDFSDCWIPRGLYPEHDQAFFKPLENEIHHYLRKAGWNLDDIEQIQDLRQEYKPSNRNTEPTGVESMAGQASRARAKAEQAGYKANTLEQKIADAEHRLGQQQARISELDNHVHHLRRYANAREDQMLAMLSSTSWRITSPLRWTGAVVRGLGSTVIKPRVKVLFQHAARYLDRRPGLGRLVLSVSERFPALAARLQRVRPEMPTEREHTREMPAEVLRLSARARQIYTAMERHRKGDD